MKLYITCFIAFAFFSCTDKKISIENEKKGQMVSKMNLKLLKKKSFLLDNDTAPKPLYLQITNDSLGNKQLTFLNNFNNSIYFYNYKTTKFVKKIVLDKDGPNGVKFPIGYHIKNIDSIYVLNKTLDVLLINNQGKVLNKVSLIGGIDYKKSPHLWAYNFPSYYYFETVTPFIETSKGLLLTGQFERNISDTLVDKFKFTANVDYKFKNINYLHTYPLSLYGNNIVWGGALLTQVFPQLHPDEKRLIYSFPVSHDLYTADLKGGTYKKVYAGSNFAGTISSLEKKDENNNEKIKSNFVRQDMYAAIIYDKFRKKYYRFLRKAIPSAPLGTSWKEKEIAVIIMDKNFNYLGETIIGTERECHWHNSFVTEEGLNIEYLDTSDINEVNLTLKIFIPK